MARAEYQHGDYKVFLSGEEAHELGRIEIKDNKIVGVPLVIQARDLDGSLFKLVIQKQDFEDLGDGIRVVHKEDFMYIQINQHAWKRLGNQTFSGTRYNGSDKVHLVVDDSLVQSSSPSKG